MKWAIVIILVWSSSVDQGPASVTTDFEFSDFATCQQFANDAKRQWIGEAQNFKETFEDDLYQLGERYKDRYSKDMKEMEKFLKEKGVESPRSISALTANEQALRTAGFGEAVDAIKEYNSMKRLDTDAQIHIVERAEVVCVPFS